jgi:hypothetical protein
MVSTPMPRSIRPRSSAAATKRWCAPLPKITNSGCNASACSKCAGCNCSMRSGAQRNTSPCHGTSRLCANALEPTQMAAASCRVMLLTPSKRSGWIFKGNVPQAQRSSREAGG